MYADRRAEIHWALDHNRPLCLKEYKVGTNDAVDHVLVWVKCGGALLGSIELARTSMDQSDTIRWFVERTVANHHVDVARDVIAELLEGASGC